MERKHAYFEDSAAPIFFAVTLWPFTESHHYMQCVIYSKTTDVQSTLKGLNCLDFAPFVAIESWAFDQN